MGRWAYIIPRLVIIGLIALAIWVGSDPLIRYAAIEKLQNATGAKVEIGQLRCSLANQKVFLKEVAIADPRSPMVNLLQAEMAYFKLDPKSLLNRQIVIESGQTTNLVFGAPRTDSGAIEGFPSQVKPLSPIWEPKQFEPIEQIGLHWIDQLQPIDAPVVTLDRMKVAQVLQQQQKFWKTELANQQTNVLAMQQLTAKLEATVVNHLDNPLRRKYVHAEADVDSLAQQTAAIKSRLAELRQLVASDLQALRQARQDDNEKLRQSFQVAQFDGNSVSKLLLTKLQEDQIGEILGWFHWFRSTAPNPDSDFQPKHKRGIDMQLKDVAPRPSFLVKSLELEGYGDFANRHINFAGSAFNLTSEPSKHSLPASFELRAQGDQHLIVSCTLDRRNEIPVDTLKITCPDLELPSRNLGEKSSMLVTLGPASRIQADIKLQATGDELSGDIVFRHSNVSLHVDQLHELAGGKDTALQMNHGLSSVNRFETTVKLSGTVDDYQYQFHSDLGDRFSGAVNTLLVEKSKKIIVQQQQKLESLLSAQTSHLNDDILVQIERLNQILNAESVKIANLKNDLPSNTERFGKIR